jgi:predicted CopG family antitoxin
MAKRQTRRTISVKGTTYRYLQRLRDSSGEPTSAYIERLIRQDRQAGDPDEGVTTEEKAR